MATTYTKRRVSKSQSNKNIKFNCTEEEYESGINKIRKYKQDLMENTQKIDIVNHVALHDLSIEIHRNPRNMVRIANRLGIPVIKCYDPKRRNYINVVTINNAKKFIEAFIIVI